jgi:hypothetical protein
MGQEAQDHYHVEDRLEIRLLQGANIHGLGVCRRVSLLGFPLEQSARSRLGSQSRSQLPKYTLFTSRA